MPETLREAVLPSTCARDSARTKALPPDKDAAPECVAGRAFARTAHAKQNPRDSVQRAIPFPIWDKMAFLRRGGNPLDALEKSKEHCSPKWRSEGCTG